MFTTEFTEGTEMNRGARGLPDSLSAEVWTEAEARGDGGNTRREKILTQRV